MLADSSDADGSGAKSDIGAAAQRHWAFQPIVQPLAPLVSQASWPGGSIDAFVLARLEAAGLTPSPPADRRTLIRRLYFDLLGLPPSYDAVERFVNDASPMTLLRLVDRILASPHYGERWGRHWLDVARYADTKDIVLVFGKARIRPYAYTYRDYVVRALNEDTPYDRFVNEQLAADTLDPEIEPWRLAALGFLTLGRTFCNNNVEVYDDQIDTVTRGLLGLSVACARCHDHKYDAIPTADYYSLYGIFANSESPVELPLVDQPDQTPGYEEYEKQAAALREKLRDHVAAQYQQISDTARKRMPDYLVKIATEPPDPLENVAFFLSLSPEDLRPQVLASWRSYLTQHARPDDPVFGPWHDLMNLPDTVFAAQASAIVDRWQQRSADTNTGGLNPIVGESLRSAAFASKADVARWYGTLLYRVYEQSQQDSSGDDAQRAAAEQLLDIVVGPSGPIFFPERYTYLYMSRVPRDDFHKLQREIDTLAASSDEAPPRAMVLYDAPTIYEPRIFIRGNPRQPGKLVPRQFLQVLSDSPREPFSEGSGRSELARAITSASNPLTSRVLVNRVWMHHLGQPLVSTPSDFGIRSDPPSHPKLMDHLAAVFMRDGWSLKKLHRRILLSATYQQASLDRPGCRQVDPENRLLWRAQRRRLGLEAMRDSLLVASGRLDRTMGGRAVDIVGEVANRRRTIYGLVDRQDLPGLFRAFDFAVPDQTIAQRPQTSTPQQALFSMNSEFVILQSRELAARWPADGESTLDQITALYRVVLNRNPHAHEVQTALRFIGQAAEEQASAHQYSELTAFEQLTQVLLLTNEWMFVD